MPCKLDEAIEALKYSNDIAGAIKLIQAHQEDDECFIGQYLKLRTALKQIAAWDIGVTPCTKEKVIYVAKKALEGK